MAIIETKQYKFITEERAREKYDVYKRVTLQEHKCFPAYALSVEDIDAGMAFMRYLRLYVERGNASATDIFVTQGSKMCHKTMSRKLCFGIKVIREFNNKMIDIYGHQAPEQVYTEEIFRVFVDIRTPNFEYSKLEPFISVKTFTKMQTFLKVFLYRLPAVITQLSKICPNKKCEFARNYIEGKYVPERITTDMKYSDFYDEDKNAYAIKKQWEKEHEQKS